MTQELLGRKRNFTALMAFDDMTAFGALRALAKGGVKVPGKCSVIGFDDVTPSALFVPSLTTIRQPMREMGARAAEILLGLMRGEVSAKSVTLSGKLVVRDSTAPPQVLHAVRAR